MWALHAEAGLVVQLDVSDDEGGLDVLLALGALRVVPVRLDLYRNHSLP